MRFTVAAAVIIVLAATPSVFAQSAGRILAVDPANFDTTCAPCHDFFQFANGGWDARVTIPSRYSAYGVDRELMDRNEALLHRILDAAASEASATGDATTRLIGTF